MKADRAAQLRLRLQTTVNECVKRRDFIAAEQFAEIEDTFAEALEIIESRWPEAAPVKVRVDGKREPEVNGAWPPITNRFELVTDETKVAASKQKPVRFNEGRKRLYKTDLARRYGRVPRSIDNWVNCGKLPPPQQDPFGRRFWWDDEIAALEAATEGSS